MRVFFQATMPHEPFNAYVRDGSIGAKMSQLLEETRPETVFFMENNGKRCASMIVEMNDTSQMPSISEPWFILFNADVTFRPIMSPEDLKKSGLDKMGNKW